MFESKNNIRSFRYSNKVAEILEGFSGNSLNDKFNNLVLYCFERLPERERELERIEKQIDDKRNQFYELCSKLSDIDDLIKTLGTIKHYGEIASRKAKSISENVTQINPETSRSDARKCVTPEHVNNLNVKLDDDMDDTHTIEEILQGV